MSRTFKTDPHWVKVKRHQKSAGAIHSYRCAIFGEPCSIDEPRGRCTWHVPSFILKERWGRRGTVIIERRSAVKQALRSVPEGEAIHALVMPAPFTSCMCAMCW